MVPSPHVPVNQHPSIPASLRINGLRVADSLAGASLFRSEGDWSTLRWPAEPIVDPLQGQLGKPGLWKHVLDSNTQEIERVFELPPINRSAADDADDPDETGDSIFEDCLAWAVATGQGKLPHGWQPPPREEVVALVPPDRLTVQLGPLLRQGELIYRPERLAVCCPILTHVPEDLPAVRQDWLRHILIEAQSRWRMVRIGWSAGMGTTAVLAEVDVTGCPRPALESVLLAGIAALRWVVGWLARSAAFLADPAQTCRALEVCTLRA